MTLRGLIMFLGLLVSCGCDAEPERIFAELTLLKPQQSLYPDVLPPQTEQQFHEFVDRTAMRVTDPQVLDDAMQHKVMSQLKSVSSQANPQVWLSEQVRVTTNKYSESALIRIEISGAVPADDAAVIVRSVAAAFRDDVIANWFEKEHDEVDQLKNEFVRSKVELRVELEDLRQLKEQQSARAEVIAAQRSALIGRVIEHQYSLLLAEVDLQLLQGREDLEQIEDVERSAEEVSGPDLVDQMEEEVRREQRIVAQINEELSKLERDSGKAPNVKIEIQQMEVERLKSRVKRLGVLIDAREVVVDFDEVRKRIRIVHQPAEHAQ